MKYARWIGIIFQALMLGGLLFLAIGKMVAMATGARVFEYQGF